MTKSKKNIIKNFENPSNEREYLLAKLKLKQREKESLVKGDFLEFVKHMWPEFIEGYHHKIIAEKFNKLARGEIKRLIVNMPPRHSKSEFAVAVYDVIMGSEVLQDWKTHRKGLDFFIKYFPKQYMVLLD